MSHQLIRQIIAESITLKQDFFEAHLDAIMAAADQIAACIAAGHKLMLFGNGGSAADAQHLAAEFINRFRIERPPLAALALSTDSSILTSIGNDYDFNQIFEKQIRGLGKKGDIAWGISTSGNSPNVLSALRAARDMEIITMGFGGGNGGQMTDLCDRLFIVPSTVTARIQEVHITLGHILCELTDRWLFPGSFGGPS